LPEDPAKSRVPECIGASNVSQRDLGESLTGAAGGLSKEYSEDSPIFSKREHRVANLAVKVAFAHQERAA
jgi:hypothetical protein